MDGESDTADRQSHEAWHGELPEEALVHLLQLVPLRQRLSCCALVCRDWARAANYLISAHIDMVVDPAKPAWQKLQGWLQQHGGIVHSVELHNSTAGHIQWTLPLQLQHLTRLQLGGFALLLPGNAHPLQRLQKLRLSRVAVAKQSMQLLPQATALTSLELSSVHFGLEQQWSWPWLLPQLTSLLQLSLEGVRIADHTLGFLPPSLTAFLVRDSEFSRLAQRQVSFAEFDPSVLLLSLTALRELDLLAVRFGRASGPFLLVAALPRMQHLQRVSFDKMGLGSWTPEQLPALTAPSALTALHLSEPNGPDSHLLPQGGVQALLPDSPQLTGLKVLHLISKNPYSPPCVWARDFARIARCCPALSELHLHGVCSPTSWQQLPQLKASLRQLSLTGRSVTGAAAAALAQLTGLTQLQVSHSSLTVTWLEQLTALQALRLLSVQAGDGSELQLQHSHGAPAVYLQLAAYVEQCRGALPSSCTCQ